MLTNIQRKTQALTANGTVTVDMSGTFLLFYANTAAFKFSIDGGPFIDGFASISIPIPPDSNGIVHPFRQIILQDTSGATNSVSLIVSDGQIQYTPTPATTLAKEAPTYIKVTALANINAGAWSAAFSGTDSGGQQRKHFILSNQDTTQGLVIGDGTTSAGIACPAGQSRIVATSGTLKVGNLTGANTTTAPYVLEVFYAG